MGKWVEKCDHSSVEQMYCNPPSGMCKICGRKVHRPREWPLWIDCGDGGACSGDDCRLDYCYGVPEEVRKAAKVRLDKPRQVRELKDVITILQAINRQLFFDEICSITKKISKMELEIKMHEADIGIFLATLNALRTASRMPEKIEMNKKWVSHLKKKGLIRKEDLIDLPIIFTDIVDTYKLEFK